jgi:hypothetical protein
MATIPSNIRKIFRSVEKSKKVINLGSTCTVIVMSTDVQK